MSKINAKFWSNLDGKYGIEIVKDIPAAISYLNQIEVIIKQTYNSNTNTYTFTMTNSTGTTTFWASSAPSSSSPIVLTGNFKAIVDQYPFTGGILSGSSTLTQTPNSANGTFNFSNVTFTRNDATTYPVAVFVANSPKDVNPNGTKNGSDIGTELEFSVGTIFDVFTSSSSSQTSAILVFTPVFEKEPELLMGSNGSIGMRGNKLALYGVSSNGNVPSIELPDNPIIVPGSVTVTQQTYGFNLDFDYESIVTSVKSTFLTKTYRQFPLGNSPLSVYVKLADTNATGTAVNFYIQSNEGLKKDLIMAIISTIRFDNATDISLDIKGNIQLIIEDDPQPVRNFFSTSSLSPLQQIGGLFLLLIGLGVNSGSINLSKYQDI